MPHERSIWMSACAVMAGLSAWALALFAHGEYIDMLGFPDGAIYPLGYAERDLAEVVIVVSVPLGVACIGLGILALRRRAGVWLLCAILLYVGLLVAVALVDASYSAHLDGGHGG